MGSIDNKLLNYVDQVDVVIALGCDCTHIPTDAGLPIVTPYEALFALFLSDELSWDGEYPIGLERTLPYIEMARKANN